MLTDHGNIEGRKIVAELLDTGLDALDPYLRVTRIMSSIMAEPTPIRRTLMAESGSPVMKICPKVNSSRFVWTA